MFFFLSVDSTSVRLDGWNYLSWNTISLTIEYFIIQVQCTEKASWFPAVITYGEKNISSIGNFPLVCHKMSSIMKTTANAIKTTSTEYQFYCRRRPFYFVRWLVCSFWSVFFLSFFFLQNYSVPFSVIANFLIWKWIAALPQFSIISISLLLLYDRKYSERQKVGWEWNFNDGTTNDLVTIALFYHRWWFKWILTILQN